MIQRIPPRYIKHFLNNSLEIDERDFMKILAELRINDGRRLDLRLLQEQYDRFRSDFDDMQLYLELRVLRIDHSGV